jgi:hypothetical protein
MRVISLASGGEKAYYDFISYVAKDKDTGFRECFVFDTGVFSDDVMSTMGQAFVLAQELAKKAQAGIADEGLYSRQMEEVEEALRVPAGAESFYADAGAAILLFFFDCSFFSLHFAASTHAPDRKDSFYADGGASISCAVAACGCRLHFGTGCGDGVR